MLLEHRAAGAASGASLAWDAQETKAERDFCSYVWSVAASVLLGQS